MQEKHLRIYLNDHLMGSAAGIDLVRRSQRSNEGAPLGSFLAGLADEIAEDRRSLEELMDRLGFTANRLKLAAAKVGSAAGRLKLNGRLVGYSALSRFLELEGLYGGVDLKLRLWLVLRDIAEADPRLEEADLDRLIERATSQRDRIEEQRLQAARRAFT